MQDTKAKFIGSLFQELLIKAFFFNLKACIKFTSSVIKSEPVRYLFEMRCPVPQAQLSSLANEPRLIPCFTYFKLLS
jgi:hypothetical protein